MGRAFYRRVGGGFCLSSECVQSRDPDLCGSDGRRDRICPQRRDVLRSHKNNTSSRLKALLPIAQCRHRARVSSWTMQQTDDPSQVARRVVEMKLEHRDLDIAIARLQADIQADELAIKRLKKRKLLLKDCIAQLESALIPDEQA